MNRLKEIIKVRAELNDIETKEQFKGSVNLGAGSLKKINKIDKPLSRLVKKNRESTQINKIGNERGEITTDTMEIQRAVTNYYELYAKKFQNLVKWTNS